MDSTGENLYYSNFQKRSEYPLVAMNRQSTIQPMTARQSAWGGPSLQPNSPMNVSHVDPQFDAWAQSSAVNSQTRMPGKGNGNGNVAIGKQPSWHEHLTTYCAKFLGKMTSTKALFLLAGIILCGIPLAIMTTLYISSNSSTCTTVATAAAVTTVSTSSYTSLPTQCYAYSIFPPDNLRVSTYYSGGSVYTPYDCTSYYAAGWYRFTSTSYGMNVLTTQPTGIYYCGTLYPGWWNGSLPTTVGQSNSGNMCYYQGGGTPCASPGSQMSVSATNCNGYYVWYLGVTSTCYSSYRFCTTI